MDLTAREWLLLTKENQEKRKKELSPQECFLLRTELEFIRFTEDEKRTMSYDEKEKFLYPVKDNKDKTLFSEECKTIFEQLSKESQE